MDEVFRLRDGRTIWREADGEAVVLDIEQSVYLGTIQSGVVLWRALPDGATRDQLCAALLDAFDVDAATATKAVDEFLAVCR